VDLDVLMGTSYYYRSSSQYGIGLEYKSNNSFSSLIQLEKNDFIMNMTMGNQVSKINYMQKIGNNFLAGFQMNHLVNFFLRLYS